MRAPRCALPGSDHDRSFSPPPRSLLRVSPAQQQERDASSLLASALAASTANRTYQQRQDASTTGMIVVMHREKKAARPTTTPPYQEMQETTARTRDLTPQAAHRPGVDVDRLDVNVVQVDLLRLPLLSVVLHLRSQRKQATPSVGQGARAASPRRVTRTAVRSLLQVRQQSPARPRPHPAPGCVRTVMRLPSRLATVASHHFSLLHQ